MAATLPDDGSPFVLLDDARLSGAAPARLYRDPVTIVATRHAHEVDTALEALRTATRGGLHAAGMIAYEAGHAVAATGISPRAHDLPLLWFGLFRDVAEVAPADVPGLFPDRHGAWIGAARPAITSADHEAALARVKSLIMAGDIYQANLTFAAEAACVGSPLALYAGLRQRAGAGHGGVIHTGSDWILSLSPELFFAAHGGALVTRPMKGTAARSIDPLADAAAARALAADPKQRAENLMIVDLMRNDLARVATPGTVAVPELFTVESYPTVHQMTSTVTATLDDGRDAIDVIRALFPCGSITGAPKLRAMEIVDAVEAGARGIYTGSIGRIDAGGRDAAFNVAIRTLHVGAGHICAGHICAGHIRSGRARFGLGSGIVADSQAKGEWEECLAKGAFVPSPRAFDLIETMAFDPIEGLIRLDAHLARLRASAELFGFAFDRHAARNELQAATFRLRGASRVRLVLARSGHIAVETAPMPPLPDAAVPVVLVPLPVEAHDFRLAHKTTDRRFYDAARAASGAFEVGFLDARGFVTEGSFTNIFVERDGILLTPPLSGGLLGGILRGTLLADGRAREAALRADDLVQPFFIGNSLRGLLPARLAKL